MTTFNEAVNIKNTEDEALGEVVRQLGLANRSYQERDGRYVQNGNYLEDFLTQYGEEEIRPIVFKKGCPAGRGQGIVFK